MLAQRASNAQTGISNLTSKIGRQTSDSCAFDDDLADVESHMKIASDKLSDADKFDLQQYITRCYGSLTTFNILFKNKDDQFRTGAVGRPNA